MRILVTGANGYIGAHVVRYLLDKTDHEVVAVGRTCGSHVDARARFVQCDFLAEADDPKLFFRLGEPDGVIHLAWRNGFDHKALSHLGDLPRHYLFLRNMMDAGVLSLAVMGTMHEVGYFEGAITASVPCFPLSLYGISKNALRQSVTAYADEKKVSIKWLRAYYILGDDIRSKSLFSKILAWAAEGKKTFPFTMGTNMYDFISVEELAMQISEAAIQNAEDGIINVCSGRPEPLKDVVERFIAEHGLDIRPEYGVFPDRKYDSPGVWGDNTRISAILARRVER